MMTVIGLALFALATGVIVHIAMATVLPALPRINALLRGGVSPVLPPRPAPVVRASGMRASRMRGAAPLLRAA